MFSQDALYMECQNLRFKVGADGEIWFWQGLTSVGVGHELSSREQTRVDLRRSEFKVVVWVIDEGTSGLWERPGGASRQALRRSLSARRADRAVVSGLAGAARPARWRALKFTPIPVHPATSRSIDLLRDSRPSPPPSPSREGSSGGRRRDESR